MTSIISLSAKKHTITESVLYKKLFKHAMNRHTASVVQWDTRGKHLLFSRKDQRKSYFVLQAILCPLQSSHVKIY